MTPLRWTLIFAGALFFCTQLLQAQQPQVEYRELIIQVPGIVSARGFPDVSNKLTSIPGLFIVAFCETQHLVMMKLDKKKLPENKLVYDAISELGYKFYVKEGATISKAKGECKDKKLTIFPETDLPSE
jgi:hypothetical protein